MNQPRRKFLHGLAAVLATLGSASVIRAETKRQHKPPGQTGLSDTAAPNSTPTPTPTTADTTARIRLWKASDLPDQLPQVRLLLHGKPPSSGITPLQIEKGNYQLTGYVDVPAGPMIVEVSAADRPTVQLPVYLAGNGMATLLVRQQSGGLTAEWIDDTLGPADNSCEFCIYNLLPASGDIQIDLGNNVLTVHLSSSHSCLRLTGIKRANYPVIVNGTDGNGTNFHWSTETDFKQYRKATLLIYPDAYERIRPRVIPT